MVADKAPGCLGKTLFTDMVVQALQTFLSLCLVDPM